ncbi:hypothetical protein QQ045_015402 [Rhodiola kirilowii]
MDQDQNFDAGTCANKFQVDITVKLRIRLLLFRVPGELIWAQLLFRLMLLRRRRMMPPSWQVRSCKCFGLIWGSGELDCIDLLICLFEVDVGDYTGGGLIWLKLG